MDNSNNDIINEKYVQFDNVQKVDNSESIVINNNDIISNNNNNNFITMNILLVLVSYSLIAAISLSFDEVFPLW